MQCTLCLYTCLFGWVWWAEMLLRLTTLQFSFKEWPCICSTAACTMKLEPATLTWTNPSYNQVNLRHLHCLFPVILCRSEAFRAKVGNTVDKVVEASKVSSNLRYNLKAVGPHRNIQLIEPIKREAQNLLNRSINVVEATWHVQLALLVSAPLSSLLLSDKLYYLQQEMQTM